MKLPATIVRRIRWLNLPGVMLITLLQRTPVVRLLVTGGGYAITSPVGQVMRTAVTVAALGAMHSRAGATEFVGPNFVSGTVGTSLQVGFAYVGTPAPATRWEFTGSLPPGLRFIPAPVGNSIPSGTPVIAGTPTAGGSFHITLQVFDSANFTDVPQSVDFTIAGGGSSGAPSITAQPSNQSANAGGAVTLSVGTSGASGFQWLQNGIVVTGSSANLTLNNLQPGNAGLYQAVVTGAGGAVTSKPAVVGVNTGQKVIGSGAEIAGNISHPNGNVFDQILPDGAALSATADAGQAIRVSFIDLTDDIVQVEFSGPGTLTLVFDSVSAPAPPIKYTQPTVNYIRGHAGIIVTGATEATNLGVFTVGRATAFDPTGGYNILQAPSATNNPANNGSPIFSGQGGTTYEGLAGIAFVAIASANGQFGGLRTANATYFASRGITGVYAPGVQFTGPVFVSDINAFDSAAPMLVIGGGSNIQITGGDLEQANGRAVQVAGIARLLFSAGSNSHGVITAAQQNKGILEQDGANVTSQIAVFNP